jgi:enamine deaminase RidA (YjgF/YER057c/UK114 family)
MFDAFGSSRGKDVPLLTQSLHPPGWQPPIGYANGISVAAGQIVFIAGQVGWDAEQHFQSEQLVPQFEQALKNILAILAQAGARRPISAGLRRSVSTNRPTSPTGANWVASGSR